MNYFHVECQEYLLSKNSKKLFIKFIREKVPFKKMKQKRANSSRTTKYICEEVKVTVNFINHNFISNEITKSERLLMTKYMDIILSF